MSNPNRENVAHPTCYLDAPVCLVVSRASVVTEELIGDCN